MKRLFIHIGMPKTGSTAIQHFLEVNQEQLAQNGISYVKAGRGRREGVSHSQLALDFMWRKLKSYKSATQHQLNRISSNLQAVATEILESDFTSYVISYEGLFPLFVDDLAKQNDKLSKLYIKWLIELADYCEIIFIVYLRRQDQWVESLYAQYQKGGDTPIRLFGFHEFVKLVEASGQLDYHRIVANLRQLPGVSEVVVRVFEKSQLLDRDVVADFMAVLGVTDISAYSRDTEENRNHFSRPYTILLHQAALTGIDREFRDAVELISHRDKRGAEYPSYFMSPQERADLVAKYQDSNRAAAKDYLDRNQLFNSKPTIKEDPNWTPPSDPGPEFWSAVVYEALAHSYRVGNNLVSSSLDSLLAITEHQEELLWHITELIEQQQRDIEELRRELKGQSGPAKQKSKEMITKFDRYLPAGLRATTAQ